MDKKRQIYFHFRVSPEELRLLNTIAEREARCASEALREVLREAGIKRGLWPNSSNQAQIVKEN